MVPLYDVACEHRVYLPLAAVLSALVFIALAAIRWNRAPRGEISPTLKVVGFGLLFFAVAIAGTLTFLRNADYRDELIIWQKTLAVVPRNERPK